MFFFWKWQGLGIRRLNRDLEVIGGILLFNVVYEDDFIIIWA